MIRIRISPTVWIRFGLFKPRLCILFVENWLGLIFDVGKVQLQNLKGNNE